MSELMRIKGVPKRFKLFATTYNVVFNNARLNDLKCYGLSDYSKSEITLATFENASELSEDKVLDTFYHEKTHAILDMMHERELSENEKFVDQFAKLWRQSDETAEFE